MKVSQAVDFHLQYHRAIQSKIVDKKTVDDIIFRTTNTLKRLMLGLIA